MTRRPFELDEGLFTYSVQAAGVSRRVRELAPGVGTYTRNFAGKYLQSQSPSGLYIPDEQSGLGTDRPMQPGRAFLGDGTDDKLEWTTADAGTLYVSYFNITSDSWVDTTMSHSAGKYSLALPAAKISNLKVWTDNTATSEQKEAVAFDAKPANGWAWLKLDDTHPTLAYDSWGNARPADKIGHTPETFHYQGSDVPKSWQNDEGYSEHVLIDSNGAGAGSYSDTMAYVSPNSLSGDFVVTYRLDTVGLATLVFGVQSEGMAIASNNYNALDVGVQRSDGTTARVFTNGTITDHAHTWAAGDVVTLQRTGSDVTVRINGTLIVTKSSVSTQPMFAQASMAPSASYELALTQFSDESGPVYPGDGNRNTATGLDVTNLYIPRDESDPANDVLGNPLAYTGKAPRNWRAIKSNCLSLDGVNDLASLDSDVTPTGEFTVEGWFEADSISGRTLLGDSGSSDSLTITDSTTITYESGSSHAFTVPSLSTGTWYHVALTRDGSDDVRLFINGVESSTGELSEATDPTFNTFGADNGTNNFDGKLCGWHFYSHQLSADQIAYLHSLGESGTSPPTPANLWDFGEGGGDTGHDSVGGNNATLTSGATWGLQDIYHANLWYGHSLYEHASSDPIRVRYGSDGNPRAYAPPAGYTLTGHYPPGEKWNRAETHFDMTGGVAAPWWRKLQDDLGVTILTDFDPAADAMPGNMSRRVDADGNQSRFAIFEELLTS